MVTESPGLCLPKMFKDMCPWIRRAPSPLLHVRCQIFLLAQLRGHRQPVYLHQASKTSDILCTDADLAQNDPGTIQANRSTFARF
jgi:hypothetical protein